MFHFGMNDDGFNSHLDGIDNINFSIFDSLKEKNKEIYEHNSINEIELNDFISKGNNDNNPSLLFYKAKKNLLEPFNIEKTESNTGTKIFINKKRNPEKISYENNNKILTKEKLKEKKEALNIKENTNRGRRKKNIEYDNKPLHSKFKEDNIIQKIKTFIFDYILEHLNKSLKMQIYKFYPLTKEININLKKEFNEKFILFYFNSSNIYSSP